MLQQGGTGAREHRAERKAKTMQITESKEVVSRGTVQEQSEKTGNNHAKQLAEDGLNKLAAALETVLCGAQDNRVFVD